MKDLEKDILDDEGHFNAKGLSLYAEAMKLARVDQLPNAIQEHLQACGYCSARVVHLFELIEDLDYTSLGKHPVLSDSANIDLSLGKNKDDLNTALQKLLDEAEQLPVFENLIETQFTYRNSQGKDTLQVIRPQAEQLCTSHINFVFNREIKKKCFVSLTHKNGRILKEVIPLGEKEFRIVLNPKEKFPSGLYYWKIMSQGDKAIVGKVFIY